MGWLLKVSEAGDKVNTGEVTGAPTVPVSVTD
jgi:hypothetical protein